LSHIDLINLSQTNKTNLESVWKYFDNIGYNFSKICDDDISTLAIIENIYYLNDGISHDFTGIFIVDGNWYKGTKTISVCPECTLRIPDDIDPPQRADGEGVYFVKTWPQKKYVNICYFYVLVITVNCKHVLLNKWDRHGAVILFHTAILIH